MIGVLVGLEVEDQRHGSQQQQNNACLLRVCVKASGCFGVTEAALVDQGGDDRNLDDTKCVWLQVGQSKLTS